MFDHLWEQLRHDLVGSESGDGQGNRFTFIFESVKRCKPSSASLYSEANGPLH